jgi:hypothetical protein
MKHEEDIHRDCKARDKSLLWINKFLFSALGVLINPHRRIYVAVPTTTTM